MWLSTLLQRSIGSEDLPRSMIGHADLPALAERLEHARLHKRSISILANRRGLSSGTICAFLNISRQTYRRYVRLFEEGGAAALFAPRINHRRKFDNERIKATLFNVLHQPPKNFNINRTAWTVTQLSCVMKALGEPVGEDVIRKIVRHAGYRWRKARIVLTSSDPNFSTKLRRIRSILSNLKPDEAFFSVDEFGPFAVKAQPGWALVSPSVKRLVPQWQQSKGYLIVTAALELSSNQVTHFYSEKKNTDEMIRMMELLVHQYRDRNKIYLSWDAASWHVSKKLLAAIDRHNAAVRSKGPIVETAPLPAQAQFLNVIESIFSGMSRAVIQNSNYGSLDDAKSAIDRYFYDRNAHFKINPRRAGLKIWGQERGPAKFSESNNCKDPRFR
jgi:transposase